MIDIKADDYHTPPILNDNRIPVTDEASAYQMVSMLEGVVRRGTARSMGEIDFAIAGKTGTTNDNTNGWFIGFTPDLAVGVYVGFDRMKPLGKNETGSTVAVPIFENFIVSAMQDRPQIPFRRPNNINLYTINAKTGIRTSTDEPDSMVEAFKFGQEPLYAASQDDVIGAESNTDNQGELDIPSLY